METARTTGLTSQTMVTFTPDCGNFWSEDALLEKSGLAYCADSSNFRLSQPH